MAFFNQLPSNPWAWLFTVIVAVGGLIFAYRSTPQKVLKFEISNNVLISKKQSVMSKLSILYDGKNIDNLTVSTITFWNNSFPTINKTDIIEAAPISISVSDGEILDASVLQGGDTPNCIGVMLGGNSAVKIVFDYIDKKEGGIIQVVHTGEKSSINVSRKIKGGKIVVISKAINQVLICVRTLILFMPFLLCLEWALTFFPQQPYIASAISSFLLAFFFGLLSGHWASKEFIPKNCISSSSRYRIGIFTRIKDKAKK